MVRLESLAHHRNLLGVKRKNKRMSNTAGNFKPDRAVCFRLLMFIFLASFAWVAQFTYAIQDETLPLPDGNKLTLPWEPILSLDDLNVTPEQAAGFRLAQDPKSGRALVVGPWLAGAWCARVQYKKPYPPEDTEIAGLYRTVDLLPCTAGVRADFYDKRGRRLSTVSYSLNPSVEWKPFTVRIDKFPVHATRMEFSFGLGAHTQGEVWFSQIKTRSAGPNRLDLRQEPKLTRANPPPLQKASGFWRVERFGETWWLIDPEGRPGFSLATSPPKPPANQKEGMEVADKYVGQLRNWGFNGLAGWHSLRRYGDYNRQLKKMGQPTMPQFAVLNYHDCFKYGQYDLLTDRNGRKKEGEHGFPDPFDPRFEQTARKRAEDWASLVRNDPNFVAWFVDNEIGFDDLHRFVWSRHCGKALIASLQEHYPDIAVLNSRWGTTFADYNALVAARPEPVLERGPMYEDFIAFERQLYKQYVDVTLRVTRQADSNHLIASNRHNLGGLVHWLRNMDLCSAYDLVAVNIYPDNQVPGVGQDGLTVLREVARRSGRPVVISEWSVPAMDSGLYNQKKAGLDWSFSQAVPTQVIRSRQAAQITADFFNEPYIVGSHWFIYKDFDSNEREANRGLVRSDGQPWEDLVLELGKVHKAIDVHIRYRHP